MKFSVPDFLFSALFGWASLRLYFWIFFGLTRFKEQTLFLRLLSWESIKIPPLSHAEIMILLRIMRYSMSSFVQIYYRKIQLKRDTADIKSRVIHLPRSTLVIDNPRRGDRITRKHIDELKYLMKLWDVSSDELLIAAAFLSISEERQDDDDELWESLRSFLRQMQLRNILIAFEFQLVPKFYFH